MIALNLIVLVAAGLFVWWLTGHDKNISGESKRDNYSYRVARTLGVVLLLALLLWFPSPLTLLTVPVFIALLLRSCISEIGAHGFLGFLDPSLHDTREIDLNQKQRYQDTIAHLIHHHRRDEAIQLCEQLKKSGELDLATLESTLEFLGVKPDHAPLVRPVNQAAQLRARGQFAEAEQLLKSLLVKNPADADAAMLLMRVYAGDLRQPGKASEVLRALEKQPHIAAAHIEFARRSIHEWSLGRMEKPATGDLPPPATVEELLAQGFIGSALERLDEQVKTQPGAFALRLQLAEIHATRCANLPRAQKLVRQIEVDPRFTPEQTAAARAKLKEWHELHLQRK